MDSKKGGTTTTTSMKTDRGSFKYVESHGRDDSTWRGKKADEMGKEMPENKQTNA